MVKFRTVEHACKRLGRCGVGLGCEAVIAGHCWSASISFWSLFTGAVNWRLLRETLVRQEVGLDSVLPGKRLGCGGIIRVSQTIIQYLSLS